MFRPRHPLPTHGHSERSQGPAFSSLKYEPPTAGLLAVSPLAATLTWAPQLTENTATLSPSFATLTSRVNPNSFVCHSYRKHPGVVPLHARIDLSFLAQSLSWQAIPLRLRPFFFLQLRVTGHESLTSLKSTLPKLVQNKQL